MTTQQDFVTALGVRVIPVEDLGYDSALVPLLPVKLLLIDAALSAVERDRVMTRALRQI